MRKPSDTERIPLDLSLVVSVTICAMEERVFFNENGILVSNARFVTAKTTYALAQVSSVRTAAVDVSGGPMKYILVALAALAVGAFSVSIVFPLGAVAGFGVGFLALVGAPFAKKKRLHYVFITTSAGEVPGLFDPDETLIKRIHDALMGAIVSRS